MEMIKFIYVLVIKLQKLLVAIKKFLASPYHWTANHNRRQLRDRVPTWSGWWQTDICLSVCQTEYLTLRQICLSVCQTEYQTDICLSVCQTEYLTLSVSDWISHCSGDWSGPGLRHWRWWQRSISWGSGRNTTPVRECFDTEPHKEDP